MHVDRRLLGWGLFFILLGIVPLAVANGLADRSLVERWPLLWPLLLIGWGAGLVLRRTPVDWIGGAVTTVTLGLMGGGLIATGVAGLPFSGSCGAPGGSTQAFAPAGGTMTAAGRFDVRFDCGTLTMRAADGSAWSVAGTDGDGASPRVSADAGGVSIQPPDGGDGFLRFDRGPAAWTVTVPRVPALDFGLTLNAGTGSVDLSGAAIRSAHATVNAGELRVDLSGSRDLSTVDATVNAGKLTLGLPAYGGTLGLTVNAGELAVCLPASAEFQVHWSGGLGSHDIDGLGLDKVADDTWQTRGYASAGERLRMDVSANAGTFGLQIGGTCGA
jgi:hypothetical protein